MRQESDCIKEDNVSTEPEILALLTREFPPSKGYPWRQFHNCSYCSLVHGQEIVCYKGAGQEDVWRVSRGHLQGEGHTIPAAIADFRAKVAAETTALGAVKANPTSGYSNVETAIFASFYQYARTNYHTPCEAIDAATDAVEEYRIALK